MDKELQKKLNILKSEIKPSAEWKKKNLENLLSQISSLEKVKEIPVYEEVTKKGFFSVIHQPAWAVFCIILIIIGGGFSAQAAKNIKPGNSLYAARIISERAQVAMTFNKEKRARLNIEFAHAHAKEITEVLADPDFDHENDKEKAVRLAQNFKQELNTVKAKLREINKIIGEENPIVGLGGTPEEGIVRSVDFTKRENGLDFYDPTPEEKAEAPALADAEEIALADAEDYKEEERATSSEGDIFEKAEERLLAKDFEETRSILKQVDEIIENIGNPEEEEEGKIKGTSTADQATGEEINSTSTE